MTNPHETYCNETATHFVAVRGQQRTRKDCATMVYAVNALGNSAHICNA